MLAMQMDIIRLKVVLYPKRLATHCRECATVQRIAQTVILPKRTLPSACYPITSGVDTSVQRIETAYNERGLVASVRSLDGNGSSPAIVNEITFA